MSKYGYTTETFALVYTLFDAFFDADRIPAKKGQIRPVSQKKV